MRSRRWKFAASLGLLLCLSASIAVGGFAADASVAEQKGYPGGGGDWPPPMPPIENPDGAPWGSFEHKGHYYFVNGWTKEADATCVSAEKWVNKCVWTYGDGSQCGKEWVEWRGKKDPNNHVNTITINEKKATCTEEGYSGDLYCKDCNKLLKKGETIPKTDHKWDKGKVTTKPTCTEPGVKTYTCTRCKTTRTETIAKTGHDPIAVPGKEPTCTETGLTEGKECKICGATLVEQKETPALDHDYQLKDHKDATCTEAGYDYYECSRDASHYYTVTIDKTEHTAVVVPAKAATCTETGLTEGKECKICGATLVEQKEIPALDHDWDDWKVTKEATCTEPGVKTRTCKRDASHTETEPIPKTGHNYTEKVVPPTCESDGYTIFTCNNCGDIYTGNVTTKLGHDYQLKDHKDATCTEAGYDYYECSRDALHNYTEAIPATDHMYGKEVVEPTCTEPGYTKYTCAYCGDSYTTDEKPELGHEEVVISGQNPTCEAEGWTESSYCKRCNVTLKAKEIIPAQGHDPIAVPGKEPTCTETGLTEGSKCQRCGKILTAQETIPALGHDWNTTSTGVDNCVNVSFRHENETVTLCPICGVQNGTQRLNKVTLYTAHAKLVVLRGVLENGMEAMTVAFYEPGISSVTACQRCGAVRDSFSSGASLPQAAENAHFTVDASLVDGYTVMLVQADGTETVLTPGISDGKAIFDVDMKGQGARLLHLVPTTAA